MSLEAFFFVGALSDAIRFKVCNCSSFKARSFVPALPVPARLHPHTRPTARVHLIIVIVLSIGPTVEALNTCGSMPVPAGMLQVRHDLPGKYLTAGLLKLPAVAAMSTVLAVATEADTDTTFTSYQLERSGKTFVRHWRPRP
ncbi:MULTISPECIES: hypothetical protein [Paraburkholderia]|uniref:hypothetical protein n=1 Tax=Paraburkholderia TaxID=1822464 RepID=UPI0016565991|nr:hypothetical protein [Paraburkholderia podalyriae]